MCLVSKKSIGGICKIKTKKYRKIIWHFGVCLMNNIREEITLKNILYSSKAQIFSQFAVFSPKKSSEQNDCQLNSKRFGFSSHQTLV